MTIYAIEYRYDESLPRLVSDTRPAHRQYLRELQAENILLAAGFLRDAVFDGALLIVRADSAAEVQALLERDPFEINGLIHSVQIREWEPTFGTYSKGFDREFPSS